MCGFNNRAIGYVKSALKISPKTPVAMKMRLGESGLQLLVPDREGFEGFMNQLRICPIREYEAARYIVQVQVEKPLARPPPDKPRNRPDEAAYKKIVELCYKGEHGGAMGAWTAECDLVMADREYLKAFHNERETVRRAMGDGRYLLNPTTALCPFDGCHHARHSIKSLSYFPFLFSSTKRSRGCHWVPAESEKAKAHASNPAIPILIKRFQLLAKQPHISDEDLDKSAGTVQLTNDWMQEQGCPSDASPVEGIRNFDEEGRAFADMTDLFDPGDISSNLLRAQWVERVKAANM
jgi:hypothetical protein